MSTNAESVQDSAGEAGTSWWLPIIAAVATFMTAIAFAWSNDFAVFLLLISVHLPAAAFTCIGLFVWAVIKRNSRHGRAIFMAFLAVPLAMGLTFYLVPRFKDEIRFLVWSHIHGNKLSEYANPDAIILDWGTGDWREWKTIRTWCRIRRIILVRGVPRTNGHAIWDQLVTSSQLNEWRLHCT